jgi:DNA-binding transcriptional LysR family regulator
MEWHDLVYLLAVKEAGSLSRAAEKLDVATSTVARRLEALERGIGLRLLDRRADGVLLTPDGQRIATLAEGVKEDVARIEIAAAALRQREWTDPIRVSATEMVVADVLAPALPALWRKHARLRVQLSARGNVVSLAKREADVAVRMSKPQGDSLVARRLPAIRLGLYASRDYLGGRTPAEIDLPRERLLLYDETYGRIPELDWVQAADLAGAVHLRTGSTRALLRAAVVGAGIALLPAPFAAREADLVEIELPRPLAPRIPWVVVHRDLRRAQPIRAVMAWIAEAFAAVMREGRSALPVERTPV